MYKSNDKYILLSYYSLLKKRKNQKNKKNIVLIAILILTTIFIYIKPIKFLKKNCSKIKYNAKGAIYKRYFDLDWYNNYIKKLSKKL